MGGGLAAILHAPEFLLEHSGGEYGYGEVVGQHQQIFVAGDYGIGLRGEGQCQKRAVGWVAAVGDRY